VSIDTVIFDLDGVILDSEEVWNSVRHEFAEAHGGHWSDEGDQPFLMGVNSMEWAALMREHNGVDLSDQEIYDGVIGGLRERYSMRLPLIPGAREAIAGLVPAFRLGVASSSPREIIEYVLDLGGLSEYFDMVVSSDEVGVGKPEPYVYLEACRRLGSSPECSAAVEDSTSGIQAAYSAGLFVVAVPNPAYPPTREAVGLADVVLGSIAELSGAVLMSAIQKTE
jgi:HAD superfamily hydrolase (TIGR01509 family)